MTLVERKRKIWLVNVTNNRINNINYDFSACISHLLTKPLNEERLWRFFVRIGTLATRASCLVIELESNCTRTVHAIIGRPRSLSLKYNKSKSMCAGKFSLYPAFSLPQISHCVWLSFLQRSKSCQNEACL